MKASLAERARMLQVDGTTSSFLFNPGAGICQSLKKTPGAEGHRGFLETFRYLVGRRENSRVTVK